jgi:hypothetical protein
MENKEPSKNCSRGQVLAFVVVNVWRSFISYQTSFIQRTKIGDIFFLQNKDFLVVLVLHDRV